MASSLRVLRASRTATRLTSTIQPTFLQRNAVRGLRTLAIEEHYLGKTLPKQTDANQAAVLSNFPPLLFQKLTDMSLDGARFKEMDANHVNMQVLSHAPGAASFPVAVSRAANDELAAWAKDHPRLAGFACLPMGSPEDAAAELERCVKEHGFLGAMVDNHLPDGSFYDADRFMPVWAKAQELDVPIYFHPIFPTPEQNKVQFEGNYPDKAMGLIGSAGFGWHADIGIHFLRLFHSGLFDKLPKLKLVLGHMGELLPFQLERMMTFSSGQFSRGPGTKSLKEVWDTNVWLTTSGMFSVNPMACLLRNTKIDRVMYSIDWPFSSNEEGWGFLQELKASGLVTEEELEMIAYKNAENLLKIKTPEM